MVEEILPFFFLNNNQIYHITNLLIFIYTIMIITEKIEIKINPYTKKHYQDLGYDTSKDVIEVNVSDLSHGSNQKILVKCDYCDNEKTVLNIFI